AHRTRPICRSSRCAPAVDCPVPRTRGDGADSAVGVCARLRRRHRATVDQVSYLDELAAQIKREVPAEILPGHDTKLLFRLYALLLLAKGTAVTGSDVHNAWAVWMQEADPGHKAIRPFEELDPAEQASDQPFVAAIKLVAHRVKDH